MALVAAGLTSAASGQLAAPQFRSTVEIVQLQVSVEGDDGAFFSGLKPEDFLLKIDGNRRPVQVVYEVDLRRQPEGDGVAVLDGIGPSRADESPRPLAARRHWMLFFDFSFTSRRGVIQARRAALEFVRNQVHPDDLLAVATANRFGIKLLTPFTDDHRQVLRAVETLGLVDAGDIVTGGLDAEEAISQSLAELADGPAGGDDGLGALLDSFEFREYVANVTNYTDQMQRFGEMLQAIEGRKHVVFLSRGFDDRVLTGQSLGKLAAGAAARATSPLAYANDPEQMYGTAEVRDAIEELVEVFREADAVVHAIDPTGLRDSGVHDASRQGSSVSAESVGSGGDLSSNAARNGHQSLLYVADGTGGSVDWAMNDISVAFAAVERATATFYMIAYQKDPADRPTVDVDVRVARPGVRVVSAPTRLTPPPEYRAMNDMQRQLQFAELFIGDAERRDIGFDSQVIAFPGAAEMARLEVVLEVNGLEIERLAQERGDGKVAFEIGGFAVGEDGQMLDSFRKGVTIDVAKMQALGPMREQRFRYTDHVDTPPGQHRLRLLLRETEIGRLSSKTHVYWSPEPTTEAALARPMVLSTQATAPPAGVTGFDPLLLNGRRLLPVAAPTLSPGESFRMLLVVYHAPRHPITGQVQAAVGLEVEDIEGDPYRVSKMKIVGSSYNEVVDATKLLIEAQLPANIRPGSSRLWARLIDQVSGVSIEEQTPVYIEAR